MEVCFVAGTPILMADGTSKPIEQIRPDDMVLAVDHNDPEHDTPKPAKVTRFFDNGLKNVVKLIFENQETGEQFEVVCTPSHRFYVKNKGWMSAESLQSGEQCISADETEIIFISREEIQERQNVYNFEVEEKHTYFVGESNINSVSVHNDCNIWTRIFGVIQAIGGATETVLGLGLGGIGIAGTAGSAGTGTAITVPTAIAGGALAAHGFDSFQAGIRQLWTRESVHTVTSNIITNATGSRVAGDITDAVIGIGGPYKAGKLLDTASDVPRKYKAFFGRYKWPEADGFLNGTREMITLKPGTHIDRYGSVLGHYTSPAGTAFDARALPPSYINLPYSQYEVTKEITVEAGKVSPWFGQAGGGIQYLHSESIIDLVNKGILKKIK